MDSHKNIAFICCALAPTDLRIPISRVRSFADEYMILPTPITPLTKVLIPINHRNLRIMTNKSVNAFTCSSMLLK